MNNQCMGGALGKAACGSQGIGVSRVRHGGVGPGRHVQRMGRRGAHARHRHGLGTH